MNYYLTALNRANQPVFEKLGDAALKPARSLFNGRVVTIVDNKVTDIKKEAKSNNFLMTTLKIITLPITLLIGFALKGLSYLLSSDTRKTWQMVTKNPSKTPIEEHKETPLSHSSKSSKKQSDTALKSSTFSEFQKAALNKTHLDFNRDCGHKYPLSYEESLINYISNPSLFDSAVDELLEVLETYTPNILSLTAPTERESTLNGLKIPTIEHMYLWQMYDVEDIRDNEHGDLVDGEAFAVTQLIPNFRDFPLFIDESGKEKKGCIGLDITERTEGDFSMRDKNSPEDTDIHIAALHSLALMFPKHFDKIRKKLPKQSPGLENGNIQSLGNIAMFSLDMMNAYTEKHKELINKKKINLDNCQKNLFSLDFAKIKKGVSERVYTSQASFKFNRDFKKFIKFFNKVQDTDIQKSCLKTVESELLKQVKKSTDEKPFSKRKTQTISQLLARRTCAINKEAFISIVSEQALKNLWLENKQGYRKEIQKLFGQALCFTDDPLARVDKRSSSSTPQAALCNKNVENFQLFTEKFVESFLDSAEKNKDLVWVRPAKAPVQKPIHFRLETHRHAYYQKRAIGKEAYDKIKDEKKAVSCGQYLIQF